MAKQKIVNLISDLNVIFGNGEPSAAQVKLMQDLESHVHSITEVQPVDPTILDSIEIGLEGLQDEHPKVAAVLKEALSALRNIGV